MRTTKRFTPAVLRRFVRQGRGSGIYEDYIGWHRVTRGDPASNGRSHLLLWRQRLRDLLSDGEHDELLFASMLANLDDVLEQFSLDLEPGPHPLNRYIPNQLGRVFPGTLEIAKTLGVRHPVVHGNGERANWVSSTDLLLVFKRPSAQFEMLAVSVKPDDSALEGRTRQLLAIEREYWLTRGVPWILVTPRIFEKSVVLTLRRTACWALNDPVEPKLIEHARITALANPHLSITSLLHLIARESNLQLAQNALWQSIWSGVLPIDLRLGWRPHLRLPHVSKQTFTAFNPLAARRSSWI